MIRIVHPDPDPDFLPFPDPGSRGQKGTGSRIPILNTEIYLVKINKKAIIQSHVAITMLYCIIFISSPFEGLRGPLRLEKSSAASAAKA
jgi:hypothetical protein